MVLDPISVLIGVPILGPIVAYLLYEVRDMRNRLLEVLEKKSESDTRLAEAIICRAESEMSLARAVERLEHAIMDLGRRDG